MVSAAPATPCLLVLAAWQGVAGAADTTSFAALTASLEEAIGAHDRYVALREERIARLKRRLRETDVSDSAFFRWNGE
ncbi:transcriptional regulator, partial [Parabacteroides distasonis]